MEVAKPTMTNLELAQREQLTDLFEEDLHSLVELTFPKGPVHERHLRQASVIVRRWLCDRDVTRLIDPKKVEITFPVLADDECIANASSDPEVDYYMSAGARFDGVPLWALYSSRSSDPPSWIRDWTPNVVRYDKLSRAMSKPMLYFDGCTFKMDEVLRFACNKLGGAHFDTNRDDRQRKLDAAAAFLTIGPPEEMVAHRKIGAVHIPLEPAGAEVLSGISVIVIVAAAMLVNIRFDGNQFVEFSQGAT